MRRFIAWIMILAAGASTVSVAAGQATKAQPTQRSAGAVAAPKANAPAARPAAAAPVPLSPEAQKAKLADEAKKREEMNLLLAEWEKESKKVTALHVIFERVDRSEKWGDQVYQGQAFLQSPDLACLEFNRAIPDADGKPKLRVDAKGQKVIDAEKIPFQRIVCTGKEVLQYEWDERAIYIYPLDKESRQKALQQGPLPFLFNMKAAEARKRYGMTLLDQNKDWYRISIVPREEIDKDRFEVAVVYLSKANFLPKNLVLHQIGLKDRQEFRFTTIDRNSEIDQRFFNPVTEIKDWKIVRNEPQVGNGPKAGETAPGQAAIPQGRPATPAVPKRAGTQPAPRTAGRQ